MEQTANRQKRRKSAFTLAEFLVVIAIITILAGVSFVAAIRYQRRLRRMEMDHTAKEIFLAAQNQLSLETANGSIERLLAEKKDDSEEIGTPMEGENEGLYYILYQAKADANDNEGIRNRLLPFGSIDETVRVDGNYVIIYEPEAGTVRAVWYSDQYAFAATDLLSDELAQAAQNADLREQFGTDKKPIGYYAGDTIQNPGKEDVSNVSKPTVTVLNEDILYAYIEDPNRYDNAITTKLVIEGLSSGAKGSIDLKFFTNGKNKDKYKNRVEWIMTYANDHGAYRVFLDDITTDSGRFANLNANGSIVSFEDERRFIPGEDIRLYAVSFIPGKAGSEKRSDVKQDNSIFAGKGAGKIQIACIRHLENLDNRISDFNPDIETLELAKQTGENGKTYYVASQQNDIYWDKSSLQQMENMETFYGTVRPFKDSDNPKVYVYYKEKKKTEHTNDKCYVPVQLNFPLIYEGNTKEIQNLHVEDETGAGGCFGKVEYDLIVKNLKIVKPDITSGDNAGGLIGFGGKEKQSDVEIIVEDVLIQYPMIVSKGIKTATSDKAVDSGALIGAFNGKKLTVRKTMAANTYRSKAKDDSDAAKDLLEKNVDALTVLAESGAAGGLIGSINADEVLLSGCASSVYVDAHALAGGLVANVKTKTGSQSITIENCYVAGHTFNGEFLTTLPAQDNTDQGRYNIISRNQLAGGIAAAVPVGSKISHTYVTASIWSNGIDITKNIEDERTGTAFITRYGDISKNVADGKRASAAEFSYCYSASLVAGQAVDPAKVIDYPDALKTYFEKDTPSETEKTIHAFPYDQTLNGKEYPMPRVVQLILADPNAKDLIKQESDPKNTQPKQIPKFARVHIGDWLEPEKEEPLSNGLTLNNGNRLWVDYVIDLPENTGTGTNVPIQQVTFSVTGLQNSRTVYYMLKFDADLKTVVYYEDIDASKISSMYENQTIWYWPWQDALKMGAHRFEIDKVGDNQVKIRFYLDNKAFVNSGFQFLHYSENDGILPGEDIEVRASQINAIPDKNDPWVDGNSYFANYLKKNEDTDGKWDGTYTALVANSRHLVNLSFYDTEKLKITKVEQTDNILWQQKDPEITANTEPYCEELAKAYPGTDVKIFNGNGAGTGYTLPGSFKPIVNTGLYSYDGGGKTIAQLRILPQQFGDQSSALFMGNAHLTVKNLNIKDPYVIGNGSAAVLINGAVNDYKTNWEDTYLSLENIRIYGDNLRVKSSAVGGVVATMAVHSVSIKNVYLYGANALIGGEQGNSTAGGLVGNLTADELEISNCLFSGYISGKYFKSGVGGLVGKLNLSGYIDGPDKTPPVIENCYVAGRNNTYPNLGDLGDDDYLRSEFNISGRNNVGGLVGYLEKGTLVVKQSFSMAGVFGYARDADKPGVGGLVGRAEDSSKLTLDSTYFGGNVNKDAQGDANGASVGYLVGQIPVKTGGTSLAPDCKITSCAYIDRDLGIKPFGTVDSSNIRNVEKNIPMTETSVEAAPYDNKLPTTYPYRVWTKENEKTLYRGDWIQ